MNVPFAANWDRLKLMRVTARVQRYHSLPSVHRQSVGEHTFGVLAIILEIEPSPSPFLLKAAIWHDATEAMTGDTPSPAKWAFPALEDALKEAERRIKGEYDMNVKLTHEELRIIKFADYMELAIFCMEELEMGNRKMVVPLHDVLQACIKRGLTDVTPQALVLFESIQLLYEQHWSGLYKDEFVLERPSYFRGINNDR